MNTSEKQIQWSIVDWLRKEKPDYLFTATLGGIHPSVQQRVRAKRDGYTAGMPDLIFMRRRLGYGGLFVEVKSAVGQLTEIQERVRDRLCDEGYKYVVVRSLQDAQVEICHYMDSDV